MIEVFAGEPFPEHLRGGVVAIGNFDGVHRGHQKLLELAQDEAKGVGRPWGIVTFEPHPRSFFRPSEPVFRLTPPALKARLMGALGAAFVDVITFDAALAAMTPEDFVRRMLYERLGVSHVVTGYDFHFGHGRKGSPQTIREMGKTLGFGASVVEQVTDDGGFAPFASSAIRAALAHGHVREAATDLGYWWTVMGEVVAGDRRGRTIGFPTLNIVLEAGVEPFQGIYAVRVRDANAPSVAWQGAGYFGHRPTFASERMFLEVFLLDFSGDLYGRTLMVEFIDLIRPDRKFETADELISQMSKDCDHARAILAQLAKDDPIARFPLGEMQSEGRI
jgi:riboflavin kinase/FMN adenylyltransferase